MDGAVTVRETLFGYSIQAEARRLDEGVHVLVAGGCKTHVGAVSWAEPGKEPETMAAPGHRDHFVSEPWAKSIAETVGQRATVACGIHYDDATKEQIEEILRTTDQLLEELLERLGGTQ